MTTAQLTQAPVIARMQVTYSQEMAKLAPQRFRALTKPDLQGISKYINQDDSDNLIATHQSNVPVAYFVLTTATYKESATVIPQRFAYLIDLYVAPEARKQGHATQLLKDAQAWAKQHQLDFMQLNVLASNTAARKLYDAAGFKPDYTSMHLSLN